MSDNKEARGGKEKFVPKERQLREPIEMLSITRRAPFLLGLLSHVDYLRHEGCDRLWTVILPQIVLKVAGRLPKWAVDWLPIVLVQEIPPTSFTASEKEVILPTSSRWLSCSPSIIRIIPAEILSLAGSPLDHVDQSKSIAQAGRGHNLRGCQLILVQDLHDDRVKWDPYIVGESRPIDCYTLGGWLIYGGVSIGDDELIPSGQEVLLLQHLPL
ncbi:hypothetical protein Cgig2_015856 [Carnegiea gigantea]|uniref:Uncharacterized protein n=1 Tax=Carnegiea gigantea TaxID=171969 RepID=A0A9Q1GTF3_9CARY|nr:hypothetical protein Cgig2_015856 [Carnegiea gigantea]